MTYRFQIFDKDTNEPLTGATIQIKQRSVGVVTDIDGYADINGYPTDKVQIDYLGYHQVHGILSTLPKKIKLTPSADSIGTVVITAKKKKSIKKILGISLLLAVLAKYATKNNNK